MADIEEDGSEKDWIASRVPFFYGWVMLPVVLALNVASSPGQTYGISVFNPHIRSELGLSHSEISGAYTLGTLLASLPMVLVGTMMDRFGPRVVLAGVVSLFGLTCVGFSHATGLVTTWGDQASEWRGYHSHPEKCRKF